MKPTPTMTDLLRAALADAPSLNSVAVATGVAKASLIRFLRGDQSLRLDMADRLAAHLGIKCRRTRRAKSER
ncbi:MAG: helix-turn-helix transcriptional regulator [Phycisphaerales bacterium]|nr:helix-turn-helix transcriptional regulator [Phycisphaerales bacterium]